MNKIGIQSFLLEEAGVLYDPERSLNRGYPGIADDKLLRRSDCRRSEAQDEINDDKLQAKAFIFISCVP